MASDGKDPISNLGNSLAETSKGFMYAAGTGDFSNFGNTLARSTATMLTGGTLDMAGLNTKNTFGETGAQRKQSEAEAAAAAKVKADIANQQAMALDAKNGRVDAVGNRIAATPGRGQTLITSNYGQPGNTLLTISRGN